MNQEHILSILYELSMVLSGETRSGPLVERFLQRLMFHTGFPCGLYLKNVLLLPEAENGEPLCSAFLETAIGDPELTANRGQPLMLPAVLVLGESAFVRDAALLADSFGEAGGWHTMLKLRARDNSVFLLLSSESLSSDLPFTAMFDPVLRNFVRVYDLCCANENHMADLETANKELEAFSYSVSHDLRAPLRSIDGFSLALLEDFGDQLDAEGQEYLQRMRHGVQRMGRLIDDLLNLSRTAQGPLSRKMVDMTALADRIIADLRESTPQRQVEVRLAEELVVSADPNLLAVALNNLLENAWKYTGNRQRARIEFGVTREKGEEVFYIRDNGTGFDMNYANKLFGVFQRLHKTDEFSGTGIGLATVQRVIHRHGGQVWAEAAVGEGATFFFTLPARGK